MIYTVIQAYLLHVVHTSASARYGWPIARPVVSFGALIGFLWDGSQGGLIEYATMHMPFAVFPAGSSYHTLEGALAAWLLSLFYSRFAMRPAFSR